MNVLRVLRGGSYNVVDSGNLRVTCRYGDGPVNRSRDLGFRLVVRRKV